MCATTKVTLQVFFWREATFFAVGDSFIASRSHIFALYSPRKCFFVLCSPLAVCFPCPPKDRNDAALTLKWSVCLLRRDRPHILQGFFRAVRLPSWRGRHLDSRAPRPI